MQKSRSSLNLRQLVSKRMWKRRSKSHPRASSPTKVKWLPRRNCTWISDSGRQVILTDAHLQSLTEVEVKILQRVAIKKIKIQLNIDVSVAASSDTGSASKSQKRRPVAKKKGMTTSFFAIGRKDAKGANGGVFGNTLENCVAYDQKRRTNVTAASDRGSRNSITSLFLGCSSSKVRSSKNVQSGSYNQPPSVTINGIECDVAMEISAGQSDARRSRRNYDDLQLNFSMTPPPMIDYSEPIERKVPTFLRECIKHLEQHGLHLVGIFRVSASKKRVSKMRKEIDRTGNTAIDPESCPHDVATLLKEFLRDLPEPLMCRNLYKAFITTQKMFSRRLQMQALSHLVQLLPTAHRDTLFVLLRFLAKVASCCEDVVASDGTVYETGNEMDSYNLATVFAPNILRPSLPVGEKSEQQLMGHAVKVIRTMIDHYEELFHVTAELMDEIYANMIDTFPEQLNYLCERRNFFDNEKIYSARFNTPLHSLPPTRVMKTGSDGTLLCPPQQQSNFNNDYPADGRSHSESLPSRAPPVPTHRRIYTRADVMHGNADSKGEPSQEGSSGSRCRTSKSKYSESDSSAHQLGSNSSSKTKSGRNSDSLNTPTKSSANVDFHSMHQQQPLVSITITPSETISSVRRPSSPYPLDRTGVVMASLKVPVRREIKRSYCRSGGGSNARDTDDDKDKGSGQ